LEKQNANRDVAISELSDKKRKPHSYPILFCFHKKETDNKPMPMEASHALTFQATFAHD
jgi:hypothetical protein